jgi:hypothetical protein
MPDVDEAPPKPEPAFVLSLVAITIAGISLLVSQVPYGRVGAAFGAGLGLLLGLACASFALRKWWVSVFAAVVNGSILVVVIALPSWLGLTSRRPAEAPEDPGVVKTFGRGGDVPKRAEWVDVSKESWLCDDVRISVPALGIGPVELTGPKEQRKWTKDKCLQVRLRVVNAGVARKIDFQGWGRTTEPAAPHLTDPTGKSLAAKTFDPGWEPIGRSPPRALFPGKSVETLLVFEPPPAAAEYLRLELPGAGVGAAEPVRLFIPRSSLNQRPAPELPPDRPPGP